MLKHEIHVVKFRHRGNIGVDEFDNVGMVDLAGNAHLTRDLPDGVQMGVGAGEETNYALDSNLGGKARMGDLKM